MSEDWNHPQCERCWAERNMSLDRVEEDGAVVESVRQPIRLTAVVEPEICCFCGFPTWAGIWVRADPADAPFHGKAEVSKQMPDSVPEPPA